MLAMSGAGGKTHPVVADRRTEPKKGRDGKRQEKIDATGFEMLAASPPQGRM